MPQGISPRLHTSTTVCEIHYESYVSSRRIVTIGTTTCEGLDTTERSANERAPARIAIRATAGARSRNRHDVRWTLDAATLPRYFT